ncbi:MAG: hypothetical protein ABIY55_13915 [Kofleriaceae bacterium]
MVSDDEPAPKPEPPSTASERPPRAGSTTSPPPFTTPPAPASASAPANDDYDLPDTIRSRLERLVPELVKKTFAAGMGAVFSTEENIRKIARESLPEMAGYIASSADGAKDKVFDVIARETREFLSNLNVSEEIAKILTTLSFEIKTEIRFIPNSDRFVGAEPDVKASVRLKRNDDKADKTDKSDKADKSDRSDKTDKTDKKDDDGRELRSRLRFWQRDKDGDGGDSDGSDK